MKNYEIADKLNCCNTAGSKCDHGCEYYYRCSDEERREFEEKLNDGKKIEDEDFFGGCDCDRIIDDAVGRLNAGRWHFVAEDEEELPENGQWCAVMYMSPISKFPRGTVARWYDGNIVTAWHEWFRELMPEACWYEPIVNGGVAKISGVGTKCVIAWMPIEMDERVYGGPGDNE